MAWEVARAGTVSGAAQALGVHHATIIRHVEALEAELGVRLFQRHARGYTPTEAGHHLLAAGQTAEELFAQAVARMQGAGEEISGELIVTALPVLSRLVMPALARLTAAHPGLRLRYLTDLRLFRLEHGEAHVAIRAGARPTEPDYVVQSFGRLPVALCASDSYIAAHGLPETEADLRRHLFVGPEGADMRAPFHLWLTAHVPPDRIVLRANSPEAREAAVRAGLGMGFVTRVPDLPAGLTEVQTSLDEWASNLWLVSHVDLHRSPKVQAVLAALKAGAQGCAETGATG
ncbi:LysR family transcriptional regulator [Phaeovulum vinaykumarii]|uniref:Transcriptional regulator, LysR family n=1 Tax=Phaeovulum vinaykumarii TaxID=407234 RepID=A0A1N7MK60_9RHOB|nr:transcriptional regulator, LysR family [Phaeovulum vinaykumarii]SOC13521.1 LysR family transcriptional regulator [Phaeovulum vinaykumarii]